LVRKNALITEETKPKDWSSSGKFLIKKQEAASYPSSNPKGNSVGKRISPNRLLEAQAKTLEKELQALEESHQKAIKKARLEH